MAAMQSSVHQSASQQPTSKRTSYSQPASHTSQLCQLLVPSQPTPAESSQPVRAESEGKRRRVARRQHEPIKRGKGQWPMGENFNSGCLRVPVIGTPPPSFRHPDALPPSDGMGWVVAAASVDICIGRKCQRGKECMHGRYDCMGSAKWRTGDEWRSEAVEVKVRGTLPGTAHAHWRMLL